MAGSTVLDQFSAGEATTIRRRILPRKEFHRVLACEQARAERNRSELSAVTFRVGSMHLKAQLRQTVDAWLDQPGHEFDRAGWLGRKRLTILLTGTGAAAATVVARKLAAACKSAPGRIEWRVNSFSPERCKGASKAPAYSAHRSVSDSKVMRILEASSAGVSRQKPRPVRIANKAPRRSFSPCPAWKRAMDVAGAGLAIAMLMPLLLVVGAWIKCASRGPVIFRQRRYGLAGRPFTLWKFRTMEVNEAPETHCDHVTELMASDRPLQKRDGELVIIWGGRFLRKFGLDELPQLVNVLRGEMSLVGPRPDVVPFHRYASWQRSRFNVMPGITGLWQVSGKNRTTFSMMMRMDVEYVRRRSLWLDLTILLRTVPAVALD
jgi:lipopolysaccharide/colanic/teichoic acid biosynthesis glycosyltransferase